MVGIKGESQDPHTVFLFPLPQALPIPRIDPAQRIVGKTSNNRYPMSPGGETSSEHVNPDLWLGHVKLRKHENSQGLPIALLHIVTDERSAGIGLIGPGIDSYS